MSEKIVRRTVRLPAKIAKVLTDKKAHAMLAGKQFSGNALIVEAVEKELKKQGLL